jgi:FAD:protein FMN transferase
MFAQNKIWRSRYEPVLGTVLDLRFEGRGRGIVHEMKAAETELLAELDRLEQVLSIYRPNSDLSRWMNDPDPRPVTTTEVIELLEVSAHWLDLGRGMFNPAVGEATALWKEAEQTATVPTADDLDALALSLSTPRYRMLDGPNGKTAEKLGDCRGLSFHAIAKGLVIDFGLRFVRERHEHLSVMINVGGDLIHAGEGQVRVGIEASTTTADNAPPAETVILANAALASSSGTRRGFRVGDQWFGHVIDPRNARPIPANAATSVIARTAASADVLATIVGVLPPEEGVEFIDSLDATHQPVACRITKPDSSVVRSARWSRYCG